MFPTPKSSPGPGRSVPLPNFSWASAKDVWTAMLQREQRYSRNPLMLSRHPSLQPRMRSILLNWLSEVSEVYALHRETYYLAVDFFDRYLSVQMNIPKHQLQLVGVTCLFMAAKVEEIYPPKVKDFAYVTDGACTIQQIVIKELVILRCLNWNLSTLTVNTWLTIYLQLHSLLDKENQKPPPSSSPSSSTVETSKCNDRLSEKSNEENESSNKSVANVKYDSSSDATTDKPAVPPKKRKRMVLNNSTLVDANENNVNANCPHKNKTDSTKPVAVEAQADSSNSQCNINSTATTTITATTTACTNSTESGCIVTDVQTDKAVDFSTKRCTKKDFISSILGRENEEAGDRFLCQRFSPYLFAQVAHLLDLSMLDIGSLKFSYNVISAAALYHFTNINTVIRCTGLKLEQIQECIAWMTPFALAIRDEGFDQLKIYQPNDQVEIESLSNIQTHTVDLRLLEKAQLKTVQQQQQQKKQPQVLTERHISAIEPPSSPASMLSSVGNHSIGNASHVAGPESSPLKSPIPSATNNILTPPRSHSKQTTPV